MGSKNYNSSGISSWALEDRPREKLLNGNIKNLSDTELIAIIISTGAKNLTAVDLARNLLKSCRFDLNTVARKSVNELSRTKGIGIAKAVKLLAALELGNRRSRLGKPEKIKISSSEDVFRVFQPILGDLEHEEFWILILNRANRITSKTKISQGGISGTVIDTRLILKEAIDQLASSIIICHNHPSGNIHPSEADIRITRNIKKSSEIMDIKLLDHIIISDKNYYSFADEGILE